MISKLVAAIEPRVEQARNRLGWVLLCSYMGWRFNLTGKTQGETNVQCHTFRFPLYQTTSHLFNGI